MKDKYSECDIDIKMTASLLESFFNASISPDDERRLFHIANFFKRNPEKIPPGTDRRLVSDLLMVATLKESLEMISMQAASSAPPQLEETLDRHISRLASTERRKTAWRWLKGLSAAAAVAAIVVAGMEVADFESPSDNKTILAYSGPAETYNESLPSSLRPDTSATAGKSIAEKSLSRVSPSSSPVKSVTPGHRENRSKTPPAQVSLSPEDIDKVHEAINMAMDAVSSDSRDVIESTAALATLPAITTVVEETLPVLASARIDTDRILLQPITTLGQSIDNVYESVGMLAEAFSGVSATFEMVGLTLDEISKPMSRSL